ncbi:MAG: hypothetical protein ACNA74_03670 [Desulfurivibrio sp.]
MSRLQILFFLMAIFLLSLASPDGPRGTMAQSATVPSSELDPISADCVTCHDGTESPHISFCLLSAKGKGCGGHIISASYAALAAKNKGLRPESDIRPELVLYEGLITCATCHGTCHREDPHATGIHVIDNFNSALCRSCHIR